MNCLAGWVNLDAVCRGRRRPRRGSEAFARMHIFYLVDSYDAHSEKSNRLHHTSIILVLKTSHLKADASEIPT